MAAKKKRTKKAKEQTLSEFQSYISGVVDFMDDDWVPDVEQWKSIVEMIQTIKVDEPKVIERQVNVSRSNEPHTHNDEYNQGDVKIAGSSLDVPLQEGAEGPKYVEADPSISNAPRIDMRRVQVEDMGTAGQRSESGAISSGKVVKGRTIDSTNGYNSEFN